MGRGPGCGTSPKPLADRPSPDIAVAFLSLQRVLPWGGPEELWAAAARHLLSRGRRVASFTHDWGSIPARVAELRDKGCSTYLRPKVTSIPRRLMRKVGFPPTDHYRWMDSWRPDLAVISVVGHLDGVEEAAACREKRVPYALVVHTAWECQWPADDRLDEMYEAYRGAVRVYFVSARTQQIVEAQLGRPIPTAELFRNPFKVPYRPNLPWPDESAGFRLASVGRLDSFQKGYDLIIDVLARPEWKGRAVSVDIYGNGGNERSFRRLADWRGAERVTFAGFTNDIENIWATHHALLMPSRVEGLPLALVEAMLCGRPAIVTDVGGMTEFVEHGVHGFVAPAATAGFVAQAMEAAWERRHEWQAMGEAAGRRARELVPADPAAVFADLVEKLVAEIWTGRRG